VLIDDDASDSLATANLPFANNKYAGKNPGICFVILYNNLSPLPTGPAGLGLYDPYNIYFIDTPCKYNSEIANKKSGLSLE
jgi:hypothetical protein